MKRTGSAEWRGSLKNGHGVINTESGALEKIPYSFSQRFGQEKGTNPEELVAAAHSSCFAMAMSHELEKNGLTPESVEVRACVNLADLSDGWGVTAVHLTVNASVPGATFQQLKEAAQTAKVNCPISKLLDTSITVDVNIIAQPGETLQTGPH